MNKRNLKKLIKLTCGDLAGECIVARDLIPGVDVEKMNDNIISIACLQSQALCRISISFDKAAKEFQTKKEYKKARKEYFKEAYHMLIADFYQNVGEIVKAMNATLPDEQKELNKAAAKQ